MEFAKQYRQKANEVLQQLNPKLVTLDSHLGTRIGIHSGPVTAGVLRGDKARFDVARIKSTGRPNYTFKSGDWTVDALGMVIG